MSTLRSIFPLWQEGDLFSLQETAEWHMVTPVKGDVAVVPLKHTDLETASDSEAAFLVLGRSVTPDGGMELSARFIGGEDQEWSKAFSNWFNRRQGSIHLCPSIPCTHFDSTVLHTTQVRFFTLDSFTADYYGAAQRRQVKKWLEGGVASAGEEAEVIGEGAEKVSKKTKADAREKGKGGATAKNPPKRPGVLRRPSTSRKPAQDKTSQDRDEALGDLTGAGLGNEESGPLPEDLRTEEGQGLSKAATTDLRSRLEALRSRLGGGAASRRVQFEEQERVVDAEGAEPDKERTSDSVRGSRSLTSGLSLRRKVDKAEASKDISSRNISAQLALQAQQTMTEGRSLRRTREDGGRETEENKEEILQLLNRVLGKDPSAGGGRSGEDPPDRGSRGRSRSSRRRDKRRRKDKGKRRKRKLVNGVLMSTSSSEHSSDGYSGSESEEFEAPMRRRSRHNPGSVLRLLVQKAQTALDQSALVEVDPSLNSAITKGVKLVTYYQLHVRPHFNHARGPMRDMYLMAQTLDLIRSGQIARAADHLAGHFLATHQSLMDQGWSQAKFLEVIEGEEMSATSASILLETRKHAKASLKAEMPDAWNPMRSRGWFGGDGKGKGWWQHDKGKSKSKKGKGKDKHDKGKDLKGKNAWKDNQDKPDQS